MNDNVNGRGFPDGISGLLRRFRIDGLLGEGTVSVVYRAWDKLAERSVAIKVLLPEASGDPGLRDVFVAKARALARFNHPCIIAVFNIDPFSNPPYLIEELVEGDDLWTMVDGGGPLALAQGCRVFRRLVEAVAYLHGQGFIHRDLKPSGIVLDIRGGCRLLDFGTGGRADTGSSDRDMSFAAPEVLRGEPPTFASDVFQLGLLLHYMLTGNFLTKDGKIPDSEELAFLKDGTSPIPPPDWSLPPAIRDLVATCCRKKASLRYDDAVELLAMMDGLENFNDSRDGRSPDDDFCRWGDESLGKIIDQRYRLVGRLGSGGMAEVFLAIDTKENREVAVKVLVSPSMTREDSVLRFQREFRACSSLNHPNLVRLYDFGELEGWGFYFAMELIRGVTVADLVHDTGPVDEKTAVDILVQVTRALAYFHPKGIVHRDLKPANIMVTFDEGRVGRVVVMDFGLMRETEGTPLTASGVIVGTPRYMSPELVNGEVADGRSDYYQLGALAYEMLAGCSPVRDTGNLAEVVLKVVEGRIEPLKNSVSGVSEAMGLFVSRCLALKKEDRYQRVEDILYDLNIIANGEAPGSMIAAGGARTTGRRFRGLLFLFLSVFACFFVYVLFFGSPGTCTVEKLEIEPGIETVAVSWESSSAYPSKIALLEPCRFVFTGDDDCAVTRHRVLIRGLQEGRTCAFRILFPSGGESGIYHATTGRMVLEVKSLERVGNCFRLSWSSNPVRKAVVWLFRPDGQERLLAVVDGKGLAYVDLPEAPSDVNDIIIENVTFPGVVRPVSLATLLTVELQRIISELVVFDEHRAAARVRASSDTDPERLLESYGLLTYYQRALQLSDLVRETNMVPVRLKKTFSERLRCINAFCGRHKR